MYNPIHLNFTPLRTSVYAKDTIEKAGEYKVDVTARVPVTKMGSYN